MNSTSLTEYGTIEKAYDFFNKKLFKKTLPDCILTLQRKSRSYGYFHAEKFTGRKKKENKDELALNPDGFVGRSDKEILGTLVHEMAHVWQQHFGKAPRNGYHDKQWGNKMKEIGLHPSNTGITGGKETGQQMTHYIIKDGPFDKACEEFLKNNKLNWQSRPDPKKEKKNKSKTKFTCPSCERNAWGKPELLIICGECKKIMLSENGDHEDEE